MLPCPFLVLTSPHLGLIADKDEGDHPNNSFSPCSAHDRRCLQKHFAKIRDRSSSGGKMKVIGVPREEARPMVRTSDLKCTCAQARTPPLPPPPIRTYAFSRHSWMPTVCKLHLVCFTRTQRVLISLKFHFCSSVLYIGTAEVTVK